MQSVHLMNKVFEWGDLTTKQLKEMNKKYVVIIPVGAIESHGNHLATSTDITVAQMFSRILSLRFDAVLFPSLPFGPCETLINFPGTITISEKTYAQYLKEIITSIIYHSFTKICFVNGHGGNTIVLKKVIKQITKKYPKSNIHYLNWFDSPHIESLKKSDLTYRGDHADRLETEMMMKANPSSVYLKEAIDDLPKWPYNADELTDYSGIMKYSVEGFPTFSSTKTGNIQFDKIVDFLIKKFHSYYDC